MRLIDADALLNKICKQFNIPKDWNGDIAEPIQTVIDIIDNFDTAFDVEKVLEQLVDDSFVDYFEYYTDGGECLITISEAIDIVKMGGADLGYNPYQE
jgi:hypothetical protein